MTAPNTEQPKSQLNIEKILDDHLDTEISVVELEIEEMENKLAEMEMKLTRLKSIRRRYNAHSSRASNKNS